MRRHLLYIFLAILTLPLVILAQNQVMQLLSKAAPKTANITIDAKNTSGKIEPIWSNFAQGGEEPPPMLSNVVDTLKELSPSYIRLDHVYDSYSVVEKTSDGKFKYDFSRLDKTVDDIIASGALPFFSLSYMPPVFNEKGSLIEPPSNWDYWKDLVKATIEHYSGKNNRNLSNVYYEVWNEPELPQFGSWSLSGGKDYRLLYFYAANGANEAADVNNYYLGAPSVGSYYPNWVSNFLNYISQNNLRLDFYSWHRYTKKPWEYQQDADNIRESLSTIPRFKELPLILSEWGFDSENSTNNNSNTAAAFTLSAIIKSMDKIKLAFAFEVKDGPPPNGGKWGLVTHEKDPNPLSFKPRFTAFKALNKIKGDRLILNGQGTFVSGLASSDGSSINIILTNYDPGNKNTENVPVEITGLDSSSYNLTFSYPLENKSFHQEIIVTNSTLHQSFIMTANSILLIEISPIGKLANFIPGKSNKVNDLALVLNGNQSLYFTFPEFKLIPAGTLGLDFKPLLPKEGPFDFKIFEIPYSTNPDTTSYMQLTKQRIDQIDYLVFSINDENQNTEVRAKIDNWENGAFHRLEVSWSPNNLSLTVDDAAPIVTEGGFDLRNGKVLTFYPINAALDNLYIRLGEQIIVRNFDGDIY